MVHSHMQDIRCSHGNVDPSELKHTVLLPWENHGGSLERDDRRDQGAEAEIGVRSVSSSVHGPRGHASGSADCSLRVVHLCDLLLV